MSRDLNSLWQEVLGGIERRLTKGQFSTWFGSIRLIHLDDASAQIEVPNKFHQEWLVQNYLAPLEEALREAAGRPLKAEFTVRHPEASIQPPEEFVVGGARLSQSSEEDFLTPLMLSRDYTFENFVLGPANRLPHAASLAVVEAPASAYNPLFVHGAVGLGKTHLLQAICRELLRRYSTMRILYLSCETFVNHFISAVESGKFDAFRYKYRHADVLVIDDIHFLANKERTQEEFFHTFNTLYQANKQIVLSSDSGPREIPSLEERLVSRFKWGLVAKIDPPEFETRVAILQKKAKLRGIEIPEDVTNYVAENIQSNIRELEGAIIRLVGYTSLANRPLNLDLAKEVLRDWIPVRKTATVEVIIKAVTEHFGVRLSDLQSKKRSRSITFPRQVCMYLARSLTDHSLEEIGGYFGGRDHTTVLHADNKIRKALAKDRRLKATLQTITDQVQRT